jgi:16S rRNA (uracil1498-N3)-methyltransferase
MDSVGLGCSSGVKGAIYFVSMNRFFVDPMDIQGDRVCLGKAQAHQICHVLRLRTHDRIVVLDNCGFEFEIILADVGPTHITGTIVERRAIQGEPTVGLTLYQGLLARDKFEHVLQKGTEVGVRCFVPVITERSIVRDTRAFTEDRQERWQRIVTEAAEQSGRGLIPELKPPIRFEQVLVEPGGVDIRLMGCPGPGGQSLHGVIAAGVKPKAVGLWIGPEGGFSDREVDLARSAGWRPFSLGRRILRTETAAVVASGLVLYELGQLEP